MVQILTAAEIKAANIMALEDGTLAAPNMESTIGRYVDSNGRRCAIGVVLNDKTLVHVLEIENTESTYLSLKGLYDRGLVEFPNKNDMKWATTLQSYHDTWLSCYMSETEFRKYYETRFKEWLEVDPDKFYED